MPNTTNVDDDDDLTTRFRSMEAISNLDNSTTDRVVSQSLTGEVYERMGKEELEKVNTDSSFKEFHCKGEGGNKIIGKGRSVVRRAFLKDGIN